MPRRSSPRRPGFGRRLVLAVTFFSLLVPFTASRAVTFDNRPKILLHVKSTTTKNSCSYGGTGITDCSNSSQINTKGNVIPLGGPGYYFVYLLVARGNQANIDGLQCGITYQNGQPANVSDLTKIDIFGWTLCATLEFTTQGPNMWPRPGGGNLMTWDAVNNCQTGEVAVAGYFYMACYGSSDVLSVIPRPVDGAAKVANCQNSETLLFGSDLGTASFSSGAVVPGCNPCSQNCGSPPSDVTPPAAVTNLEVTSVGITTVSLRWTAPGDDGASGTANGFDVRYSTSPITAGNFDLATAATGEPVPGPAGTIQSMAVAGLTDETAYYFALRTADESGNVSGISNVVPATTLPTWLVRVTPAVEGNCAPAPGVCGSIPIGIVRIGSQAVRAYSISFQVNAPYVLCSPGITEGSYLSDAGATAFQTIDEGGGHYTVDATILGSPCGTLAGSGTLFTVNVERPVGGALPVTITQVIARDCTNADITSSIGSYSLDVTPPTGLSNVTATRITTGNPPGERTGIRINYTGPDVTGVTVYRAPFGGYPEYDESGGVAPGPQVTYPPGPPWTLTAVQQSGDVDSPPTRDFWYYAVFPRDGCGNVPTSVTRTAGTLNYHLGDAHNGVSSCQGDNAVDLSDVSFLGAHYGATLPHDDPLYCLDVGPTTDHTVNGRPLTDHRLQFEDLVLFGLNFSVVSAPRLRPAGSEGLSDRLSLDVGDGDAGTRIVRVMMEASGRVHGLSVGLDWNPAEATPIDFQSGSLSSSQGAPAMVLSGAPGSVDAVLMGAGSGLSGSGDLAAIVFRVTPGTSPRFGIKSVQARDIRNQPVDVRIASPDVPAPGAFPGRIDRIQPNPFSAHTDVVLVLSEPSTVRLEVLDVRGRLVREIEGGIVPAGEASFSWDGRNDRGALEPSGFYVVRAEFPDHVETRSIRLVR